MTKSITPHFGRRLRELRLERGFKSQQHFADHLGVSKKTVTRHEKCARAPRATDRVLAGYLRVLCVGELYLVHGIGPRPAVTRIAGRQIPPSVEQYVSSLQKRDAAQATIARRLMELDWAKLGTPNPTMRAVAAMHAALDELAK